MNSIASICQSPKRQVRNERENTTGGADLPQILCRFGIASDVGEQERSKRMMRQEASTINGIEDSSVVDGNFFIFGVFWTVLVNKMLFELIRTYAVPPPPQNGCMSFQSVIPPCKYRLGS